MHTTVTDIQRLSMEDYIPFIFERHSKPLYAMAVKWCKRVKFHWEPKELMSELYIKMWENRLTLRAGYETKRAPYLYKMMNNLALEKIRSAKDSFLNLDQTGPESLASHNHKNDLIYQLDTEHFLDLLNQIKDKTVAAIVQLRIQGYKPSEIADILQLSENVVNVRFSRFKPTLKKLWKAAFGNDIPKNWKI